MRIESSESRVGYRCGAICCLILFAIGVAFSQSTLGADITSEPYIWKNVKVVAGGFIPGIVFSPVEKGLAYCRTDIGGCYRWDDSAKKWIPLTDFLGESNYFGGESIAPDPIDANTVYSAAGMYSNEPAAMLRSRDKGKTWDVFPVTFRMGGNEDGRGVGERLAIDPNDNRVLYFGSRHEGLCKSSDSGATWKHVEQFPLKGLGNPIPPAHTHGGLSFVVFDPSSGTRGSISKTIFVGSCDPGDAHLFRSDDGGESWSAVANQPSAKLLAAQAQLDKAGILYITYGNGIGPNGVTDGAVWKLDIKSNAWTDITPNKSPDRKPGGYFGLSLDRQSPGTLAVATMNRWSPSDTIWRSTDGGATWSDIVGKSDRDVSLSPYLYWGDPKPKLGWWMAALAIDPFDSNHAVYATGATMYGTNNFSDVNKDAPTPPTHWQVAGDGMEETAVITLMSPTEGAHLLSGFGDIGGFTHDDLDVSPRRGMFADPIFNNTNTLDYAEKAPNIVVRSGQPHDNQATLAWSDDFGRSWHPLMAPAAAPRNGGRRRATPAVTVSADGKTFMLMTNPPMITSDRGENWSDVKGLPATARPIADRVDAQTFYAIDFETSTLYTSSDGGKSFAATPSTGLPASIRADAPSWHEAAWPLIATLGTSGDLWLVSKQGLFHSTDRGATFHRLDTKLQIDAISFGKAPSGSAFPAIFAIGTMDSVKAIWRSDDAGVRWIRINDDQHQYGTRFRCISGDPRIFGRVYVGTDGRGILYADRTP